MMHLSAPGPLEGILVVSLEQAVAAPYASMRLADAGARVIKVERAEGDFARGYDCHVAGHSAYFVWLNRGKESVRIDLRDAGDKALFERLLERADVFLHNLKPGSLERLGLTGEQLRARHPRLITCEISGFGRTGPLAGRKAYDLIIQAEAGLCAITGTPDGPARAGISLCDIAAGVTAHAAILEALFARERTGSGTAIEVALFDALAEWMNVPLLQYLYGGVEVERSGVSHPTIAPYGAFACATGERIIFSIQNEREWVRFCREVLLDETVAALDHFKDVAARVRHRPALDATVAKIFAAASTCEMAARLDRAGVAHGRLNEIHEAAVHPHLRFIRVETGGGEVRVVAPAAIVAGAGERPAKSVPELGEHDEMIRREFAGGSPSR